MSHKKVVITGGGTGGHVFPALAIAEELRRRGIVVLYVGSAQGMESKLVPERGFPFFTVPSGAIKNQSLGKIIKTLRQLLSGIFWSISFLKKERPGLVIGVGGYVSVPICLGAFFLRIPVFLQEQNASVGIANRFLGKLAKRIFLGFRQAESAFNSRKCIVSGNPLREVFFSSAVKPLNPSAKHLLILGGSQGAKAINSAVSELLPEIYSRFPDITITHQTGQSDCPSIEEKYRSSAKGRYSVLPFIQDMAKAYSEASLVISRSGALTVSELIQSGRPAVFVPYPRQGQNDQTANASMVAGAGAAVIVEQGEGFRERLWSALESCFFPEQIAAMGKRACDLRSSNGLATIGDHVEKELNGNWAI